MIRTKPQHGGKLRAFCKETGLEPEHCLDLSTGISPWNWPVPPMPKLVWETLPGYSTQSEDLLRAASGYYGCSAENILPVSGSQSAIQNIPSMLNLCAQDRVALPQLGYEEHSYRWAKTGAEIQLYRDMESLAEIAAVPDVRFLVVINPNNPTGETIPPEQLLPLAELMASRSGFLLVDEAFVDTDPSLSLAPYAGFPGLLVLRSVGKFFGLPGLRLGFALGPKELLTELEDAVGPWSVNGAAEYLGAQLLSDQGWIQTQKNRLQLESGQMFNWLKQVAPDLDWNASSLFVSARGPSAEISGLASRLASCGVLVRRFEVSSSDSLIRIGLADAQARLRIQVSLFSSKQDNCLKLQA